jgi:DNA repair exonuclease SbcCD ATPase subunit
MPAAINLQKIIVTGWKAIDSRPVEILFNGESWLIHGGNETGKSSIFSAIRAALFEAPDVASKYAENWVNNQTPNGAQIELELLIDAEEFTVVKTRGTTRGNGSTTLYEGWGGRRAQISRGTDAVNEILELIGAKPRGGAGRANPEQPGNWGILAWLLAPQGMDSVTPARDQGTQTIGLERAVSEQMILVEEVLKGRKKTQLTDKGNPIAGGTYKAAKVAADSAIEKLSEIEGKRGKYTQLLQDITKVEKLIEEEEVKLVEARQKIDDLHGFAVDLTGMDGSIEVTVGKIKAKELEITAAEDSIKQLKSISNELNTLMGQLDTHRGRIITSHDDKKELDSTIKANDVQINLQTKRILENTEDIQNKRGEQLAAVADSRRSELLITLEKLDDYESKLNKLLEQGDILSGDELKKMSSLVSRFEHAEEMLKHISQGMGVSVQLEGELKANWDIDGIGTEVDSETVFAQKMKIKSKDFTLNLKKESAEDKDWVKERAECISEFEKYSVEDSEELRAKIETEKVRSNSVQTLRDKIETISKRDEIEERLGKLPEQNNGEINIDEATLKVEIEVLEEENRDLEKSNEILGEENEPLQKQSSTLGDELNSLRASEKATDALAKNAAKRRDDEIEANGVIATRKKLLKNLNNELETMKDNLQQLITQKETEEAAATDGLKAAIRIRNHIERELIGKRGDLNTLNDNADELGGSNLQQAIVEANIAVNDTKNYLEKIERDVRAEERLLQRFISALKDATEFEIGPIKNQVEVWLGAVTEGKWTQLDMDSKLNVTRIAGPANIQDIAGEKVGSGGLKQVIHALIRLAVACKIHDDKSKINPDFPPVALVMDESQGYVDDERVIRLVGRFNKEIESGRVQVIALSHRRDEFQALHALNYNIERREVTDDRDV